MTGPATAPITLPDDIQVQIVSATSGAADPAIYDSDPTENTLATITTEITNRSNATFSFPAEKSSVRASLLYGVNRYKATGWAVSNGGASDLPGQLVAGTSAKMTSKFTLRKEGLDSVVFQFSPNGDTAADATFTDVQKLFR
ncbi:hypothetical protein JOF56_003692 [Kibdelosporangium banguiense]|uniref:DUF4352 domain-containing protein n=1 Tax=Kibdelosporangium banguiense TaxID=1365924 RepID=A0ABS4TFW2_9PSEU|nr:hypothetical protein [Kibdelosporangium banguiense]MBP2323307.1 hypothetical protein [Kibdelosporangium banguiense]